MADATFKMTGHRELIRKLEGLDRKLRRSISTKAVRAGAKVQLAAIKAAAPVDSGAGRRALGTKIKQYRGIATAITGERVTRRRRDKEPTTKAKYGTAHFHLVEFGTGERFHTGEKMARRLGRDMTTKLSSRTVLTVLQSTGSFGRNAVPKWNRRGRLQFSQTIRNVQAKVKAGQSLGRRERAIAADIRKSKRTGKVTPRPFFQRAWRASAPAAQAALVNVLRREIESAARGAA